MREPILKEIRKHIQHPRYGDRYFGDWSALKLQQRDDIFRLCQYTESLESVEKQLFKENKKLKEILKINNEDEYIYSYEELIDRVINLQREVIISNSRCEKIRDYINSTDFVYDEQYKKKDKIENILNGVDTNEKI